MTSAAHRNGSPPPDMRAGLIQRLVELQDIHGGLPREQVQSAATLLGLSERQVWRQLRKARGDPAVHGTWRGTLDSYYEDPTTKQRVPPDDDVCLVVRQRFWSLSMQLITKESKSKSIVGVIDDQGDGTHALVSIYRNTPKLKVRERSPIHHGAVMLDVSGKPANRLEGFYWTDRKTMGELTLHTRHDKLISDYSERTTLS